MARLHCDYCEPLAINGLGTHELGCPEAWKDPATGRGSPVECFQCGCTFEPEERGARVCNDCAEDDRRDEEADSAWE